MTRVIGEGDGVDAPDIATEPVQRRLGRSVADMAVCDC
jgi:hypothetical protein